MSKWTECYWLIQCIYLMENASNVDMHVYGQEEGGKRVCTR